MPDYAMMATIRSDIVRRIDDVAAAAGRISLASLSEQLDAIRRLARQHHLGGVEDLAGMLETALAYHGHAAIILSYLDLMRDAVEHEQSDAPLPLRPSTPARLSAR